MNRRFHSFLPGKFIAITDLDQELHEARAYVSFRGVKDHILGILNELAPLASQVFDELPDQARIGELHNDSFQVIRAQRLHPNYSAEYIGTGRNHLTSATGIHVVSGTVVVESTTPGRAGRIVRQLDPGHGCILEDNETHRVYSIGAAEILQVATPRTHWGRTMCLPASSTSSNPPIGEKFDRTRKYVRSLTQPRGGKPHRLHTAGRELAYLAGVLRPATSVSRPWQQKSQAPRRVMFVHAHPDDESSKGAAAMVQLVNQGHEVMIVTCTGGEAGSVLNPAMEHVSLEDLPAIRRQEMETALQHLGVRHHRWLGYRDSGMPADGVVATDSFAAQIPAATADLVSLIREFQPDVLVTYDETGGYPHPDHIATHQISMAAVDAAADSNRHRDRGKPWTIHKVYYHRPWESGVVWRTHLAARLRGRESPFGQVLRDWRLHPGQDPAALVTTEVWPGYSSIYAARQALLAHRTQVDPKALAVVPLVLVGPDRFQRVVPAPRDGERIETSLLAGLPGKPDFRGPASRRLRRQR